jgi:tetratricopeptide (TPR) repeat protein
MNAMKSGKEKKWHGRPDRKSRAGCACHKALVALALIVSVSFFLPDRTQACGPFFTDAIFVYTKHPDFPLENFAAGKLGVLQPSYARSYLVAAYRNLTDNGLSATEAKGIRALWEERLSYGWELHDEEWIKSWVEARKKVPGVTAPPEIKAFRNREKPHEYQSYLNCQQDAFDNAVATLNERIKRLGADSPAVRDWVAAQDTVFTNCGGGRQIPEAARPDQDPLIRADRDYQIAAANFYAGSFDEARQQFDLIARDNASPWHDKAAYLAARSLLRKGSFVEKEADGRPALAEAETRLNTIVRDNSLASSHRAAARLLNLTRLRLHPEEKIHELAHVIMKKGASADFKQDVWDYTVLLDKFLGDSEDEQQAKPPATLKGDELTDWVLTFEDESAEASTHALQRWEQTKSLPWLLAAMAKSEGQKLDALLNAAAGVDHNSPAFPSLAFHAVRLLSARGRVDEARVMLDQTLANDRRQLTPSALNLVLGQRMMLAANLNEFLHTAQRKPAGFSDDNDGREIPEEEDQTKEITRGAQLFFATDSARIFNQAMPVAILKDAARSTTLAPNLRRDVTQAAFVRAAMLDERDTAMQAAATLAAMQPELRQFLSAYERATTPEAKRFAAAFLSLKFPGLRPYVSAGIGRATPMDEIDSYRDNYWCAEPPASLSGPMSNGEEDKDKTKTKPIEAPAFLKASKALGARQFAALQGLGTAPNYLCRIAIEWTEKNPADPRSPEALHLAVRSTRYGCTDKETGRWSKAAYDLLHRRYPNTVWAKNTKYWFKG